MAKTVLVPAKVRMLALNTINFGRVEESSRLGWTVLPRVLAGHCICLTMNFYELHNSYKKKNPAKSLFLSRKGLAVKR